jgi:hypothetical protein
MNPYLQQKAAPWVSCAVLAGGMASALILVMLFRVQARADASSDLATSYLGENLPTPSHASQPE